MISKIGDKNISSQFPANRKTASALTLPNQKKTSNTKSGTTEKIDHSVVTTVSSTAKKALQLNKTTNKANNFIKENARQIYENSLKPYRENLATIATNPTTPTKERTRAQNALTQREFDAFAKYARQSPPDMRLYFEKYVQYLDSLSPEELNTTRYRGQRVQAVAMYERLSNEQGKTPDDLSGSQNPLLLMLQALEKANFNIRDSEAFILHYKTTVSPLLSQNSDFQLKENIQLALEILTTVQQTINAALQGDNQALNELKKITE